MIVPRWPGKNPAMVASESVTSETTTPTAERFSTSKVKVLGDAAGSVADAVGDAGGVASGSAFVELGTALGSCDGLGLVVHAPSAIASAVMNPKMGRMSARSVTGNVTRR
jgi:hypothetical protein